MGDPARVVPDRLSDHRGCEVIAERLEYLSELFGREQIEEHERVGLLANLVAPHRVTFGIEDQLEATDVAVASPVCVEIDGFQSLVPVKLRDDLPHERHVQMLRDLRELHALVIGPADAVKDVVTSMEIDEVDQIIRACKHPSCHHVRVRVVVYARSLSPWVAVVELIGTHDRLDSITTDRRVEPSKAREESSHLEDQLGAALKEPGQVRRRLEVAPRVVGHGKADMALIIGAIGYPAPSAGVVEDCWCLVSPVTAALPGEHRAAVAGTGGRGPRSVESARPIAEKGLRDLGQPLRQYHEHEKLVPE